jgi:hypothetical protein
MNLVCSRAVPVPAGMTKGAGIKWIRGNCGCICRVSLCVLAVYTIRQPEAIRMCVIHLFWFIFV